MLIEREPLELFKKGTQNLKKTIQKNVVLPKKEPNFLNKVMTDFGEHIDELAPYVGAY